MAKRPWCFISVTWVRLQSFLTESHLKMNSICPPSGNTHEPEVVAYLTVKHTVGHYGVLRSSNAPTFLWNFMLRWTHLYLYLSLTFKLQGRKHEAGFLCFIAENSICSDIKTVTAKQKMSLLSSYETIISKLLLCDMSLICKTTVHQLKLPAKCWLNSSKTQKIPINVSVQLHQACLHYRGEHENSSVSRWTLDTKD